MRNNYKEKKFEMRRVQNHWKNILCEIKMSRPISEGKPIYLFLFKGILLPFK